MAAYSVTRKLFAVVKELPKERQEQLLELARAWMAPPAITISSKDPATLLQSRDRLDKSYLNLARSELQEPPDLATVHAALACIPGSLTADCIAERDDRL